MIAMMYMPVIAASGVIGIGAVCPLNDAFQLNGIIIRAAHAKIGMRVLIAGCGALHKPLVERIIEQAAGIICLLLLQGSKGLIAPFPLNAFVLSYFFDSENWYIKTSLLYQY